MIYDLVIIGGAGAGLTAAIYAARKKMNALVITGQIGGQSLFTDIIENFPGFESISGRELITKIRAQVEKYGVPIREGNNVASIKKKDDKFLIKLDDGEEIESKSIIIATGKSYRKLNIPGGKEFENKGVSFCSTCDAPLFEGKDTAVIGSGNSGLTSALDLAKYANKIYILEPGPEIKGDELLQERLRNSGKVEFLTKAKLKEIKGDKFVEKIIYQNEEGEKELSVQGVFVNIGWLPATDFLKGFLDLNNQGEIIINCQNNATSVPGVFAAGDVTDIKYKQIIMAAGEGAKAALSAHNYLVKS